MSTRTSKRKQTTQADESGAAPVAAAAAAAPAATRGRGRPATATTRQPPAKKTKVKEEEEAVKVEDEEDDEEEAVEIAAPPAKGKAAAAAKGKAAAAAAAAPAPAPTPAAVPAKSGAAKAAATKGAKGKQVAAVAVKAEEEAEEDSDVEELPQVKSEADDDDEEEEEDDADMADAQEDGEDEEEDDESAGEEREGDADMRWAKELPEYDAALDGDSEVEDMGSDSDDDEDGEDDDDEDADADEDNAGLNTERPAKPLKGAKGDASAEQFGSALTSLLSKPLPQSVLEGRQAPVLVADRTLAARHQIAANPERALKRAALERKLARKYMLAKDHHVPQMDNVEKKLMRIATKGVVTLFNAVAKQQKELKALQQDNEEEKKKVEVSKSGFLQLLKTEGANVAAATSTSLPTPATMAKKEVKKETPAVAAGGGWKVLQEDYLMGGKLTDWDKAVHSSEEEEEEDEE